MKIVRPTIIDPWQKAIAKAKTVGDLEQLRYRMQNYRVLDPACGSGNFLYLAYRELKRLERELLDKLDRVSQRQDTTGRLGFVTARQFFGMDINPFAVELAKVTMMIARKLAIDELHMDEEALPLDNLDDNFRHSDALITPVDSPWATPEGEVTSPGDDAKVKTAWPPTDVIIGNPPFLGAKRLKPEYGPDYVNAVRKLYPEVPGMADFCVYWFRRSHDHLPFCTSDDPVAGRAGLVGTQNIRNNKSREGGLDHIVKSGTIIDAVDNQPWSGEANVHVSIANWVKHEPAYATIDVSDTDEPVTDTTSRLAAESVSDTSTADANPANLFIPAKKRLWFKLENKTTKRRKRGSGPATKQYELDKRDGEHINAALSDQTDVTGALPLGVNKTPQVVFQGVTPGHDAFLVTPQEASNFIRLMPSCEEILFPYLVGQEVLTGDGKPDRFVIDFQERSFYESAAYKPAFERIQNSVLPIRQENVAKDEEKFGKGNARSHHKQFLEKWWKLVWNRADMVEQINGLNDRYMVCSRVTKRPVFLLVSSDIRPGDALQVFCFDDDYSFGLMQSQAHWIWFVTKCSKLKSDYRYTPPSVFDTFPWPQGPDFHGPSLKDVKTVAAAGIAVRRVRDEALATIKKGGLREVYRKLELPGKNPLKDAHAALDAAVLKAYGFSARKDLLQQLLDLNRAVATREANGESVTAPGIPKSYTGDHDALVTDDCIRP